MSTMITAAQLRKREAQIWDKADNDIQVSRQAMDTSDKLERERAISDLKLAKATEGTLHEEMRTQRGGETGFSRARVVAMLDLLTDKTSKDESGTDSESTIYCETGLIELALYTLKWGGFVGQITVKYHQPGSVRMALIEEGPEPSE